MHPRTRVAWLRRIWPMVPAGLLAWSMSSWAAAPASLVEPSTHTTFAMEMDLGTAHFRCLGVGVRKLLVFKVYSTAYCLEAGSAQALTQRFGRVRQAQLEGDPAFFAAAAGAPGDKLVIMQLVRNVSRKQLADAFSKDLRQILPPPQVAKLVAAIPADLHQGQTARLWSHGGTLHIEMGGQVRTIDDSLIAERLWQVWLGPHSITPSLKHSLAQEVGS